MARRGKRRQYIKGLECKNCASEGIVKQGTKLVCAPCGTPFTPPDHVPIASKPSRRPRPRTRRRSVPEVPGAIVRTPGGGGYFHHG